VSPTTKGQGAERWTAVAKSAAEVRQECSKGYRKKGEGAVDLYKKALGVVAEELCVIKGLKNKGFAESNIESWHWETKKLLQKGKVRAFLD
jgi:hypothetical protein